MTQKLPKTQLPAVIRMGMFDMQVCVPKDWSDAEVRAFAAQQVLCGTEQGWQIRTKEKGDSKYRTRVECANNPDFVHIVLDA